MHFHHIPQWLQGEISDTDVPSRTIPKRLHQKKPVLKISLLNLVLLLHTCLPRL